MSPRLTAKTIRERLAGTRMPSDPLAVAAPTDGADWRTALAGKLFRDLKPAGVLIPILDHAGSPLVLLTERSERLKNHAGQVSFPGGRMEPGDPDIAATALRETHEEVGIRPEQVEIAGYLDPMATVTGYAVTPVVGLVRPGFELALDRREVVRTFEVPLSFLMDEANERHGTRELHGVTVPIVEFHYAAERIWGATAVMLVSLRQHLLVK